MKSNTTLISSCQTNDLISATKIKNKKQIVQKKTKKEANSTKEVLKIKKKELFRKRKIVKLKKQTISEERLKEAADILKNVNHKIWQVDKSCNASIHRFYKKIPNNSYIIDHLKCLRQCLLRRDWSNFCRMMCNIPADPRYHFYYPVFLRYGAICLAHLNLTQFDKFSQKLITRCHNTNVLTTCTSLIHSKDKNDD